MVSLVIGTRGKRIKSLVNSTKALIVVSQPIYSLTHRPVSIKGTTKDVSYAIYSIHKIMEEKAYLVDNYEYTPEIINLAKIEITAKFVYDQKVIEYFIDKKIQVPCDANKVDLKIQRPVSDDTVLKNYEWVILLGGPINQVEKWVNWCIEKSHEIKLNEAQILIPCNLVSKLIGSSKSFTLRKLITLIM